MKMTPQRWEKVKVVLSTALERGPGTRGAFLDAACVDDTSLRREVDSLLSQQAAAERLLDSFADGPANALWREPDCSAAGGWIGPYEIVREIGRGGMGAVYLARRGDQQFEKQVAVKLIKRGMDTDAIVRRFRAERQILARLDHPNIARLLDAGTTGDGLPYFIMEYVDGVPITQFADELGLSTAARLRLFQQVCAAVHFAHQRLVIHRDLKPGNILVTAEGKPKLLDFGVAKLLDPTMAGHESALTLTGQRPMTPSYASPEQALGVEVTTASDVYSLGALLYELLAGRAPHRFTHEPAHEVARVLCEQEPARPSTVAGRMEPPNLRLPLPWRNAPPGSVRETRRRLRGDVDNIVLMAMRKAPERRYVSAAQFSADIGAFLDGLPVRARKDTLHYRTRKFIVRNKVGTAAAVLIALALLGGTITTAWQARVARRERARAERRFNDVRRLANSFLFEMDDEIGKGPTRARQLLVSRAREYLDSLATEAGGDRTLQRELASAYQKLGDVQSRLNEANVGDTAGALKSYRKALALRLPLLTGPEPSRTDNDALRRELASNYQRLGDMLSKTGHTAAALDEYRRSLPLLASTARAHDPLSALPLVAGRICVGRALVRVGDLAGAGEQYRDVREVLDTLPAAPDPARQRDREREETRLGQSVGFLAALLGHRQDALAAYRHNVAVEQAWIDADPADIPARRFLMDSHEWVGIELRECGDPAGALIEHRHALALCQAALAADSTNIQTRNDTADVLHEIGNTLLVTGDTTGALVQYRQALDHYTAVASSDPVNVHAQRQECAVQEEIAGALERQGDLADALARRRQDLTVLEQLTDADPANVEFLRDEALCLLALGPLLLPGSPSDQAQGESDLRRATAIFEQLTARSPLNAETRADLARCELALARATARLDANPTHRSEVLARCRRSVELWGSLQHDGLLSLTDADQPGMAENILKSLETAGSND